RLINPKVPRLRSVHLHHPENREGREGCDIDPSDLLVWVEDAFVHRLRAGDQDGSRWIPRVLTRGICDEYDPVVDGSWVEDCDLLAVQAGADVRRVTGMHGHRELRQVPPCRCR